MHAMTGLVTLSKPGAARPGRTGVPDAMFWRMVRTKGALRTFLKKVL